MVEENFNQKPRKRDFTDMREFMRAAAAWAEDNRNEWPWGGPKDEDDEYYFVVYVAAPQLLTEDRADEIDRHQPPNSLKSKTEQRSSEC